MIKIAVCDDETCIADILGEKITEFFEKKDFYTGKVKVILCQVQKVCVWSKLL